MSFEDINSLMNRPEIVFTVGAFLHIIIIIIIIIVIIIIIITYSGSETHHLHYAEDVSSINKRVRRVHFIYLGNGPLATRSR